MMKRLTTISFIVILLFTACSSSDSYEASASYSTSEQSEDTAYYDGYRQGYEDGYKDGQNNSISTAPVKSGIINATDADGSAYYVLNKNTKKFHKPDCSSVKQMNTENKILSYHTRDQIIDDGYSPCGRCNP